MNSSSPVLAASPAHHGAPPLQALLVEDNEDVRGMICELLAEQGVAVVACGDAEAAEKAFDGETFDLVLTDISLPSMSGTNLARTLLRKRPDQWLAFCSGYAMEIDPNVWGPRVRALLKPFEVDELHELLQEVRATPPVDGIDTGNP